MSGSRWLLVASVAVLATCSPFSSTDSGAEADSGSVGVDAGSTDAPASDVSSQDSAPPSCDEPGLLGRWQLQEGMGTRAFDCTSGAHHGELVGGPTWVDGLNGRKAVSLVGGDSGMRIDLDNPTAFRLTGAMTLSAWIYAKSVASFGRIISKSALEGDRGWDFFLDPGGTIDFRIAIDAFDSVSTSKVFPLNAWKHVAAVYEPKVALRIYVDGTERTSTTSNVPGANRDSTQDVYIGARSDCCTLDGMLSDVRIYGRALSATEIAALFAAQ